MLTRPSSTHKYLSVAPKSSLTSQAWILWKTSPSTQVFVVMYISHRAIQIRNLAQATVNGSLTLIVLLIAPLGLAAVIINTVLVTLATYFTATISDRVIYYLQKDSDRAELLGNPRESRIQKRSQSTDLDR